MKPLSVRATRRAFPNLTASSLSTTKAFSLRDNKSTDYSLQTLQLPIADLLTLIPMFTTFESAELEIPPIFEFPDQRWWGYVGIYRSGAYFHMVIEYDDERGERVIRTLLYAGVDQVLGTVKNPEVELIELQLMRPPRMPDRKTWSMELLSEILMGYEPDSERSLAAVVYVLASGRRLVDSVRGTPEVELEDLKSKLLIDTSN